MLNWALLRMIDPIVDDLTVKMFTEEYKDNPYVMVTAAQKLTPKAIIEAGLRSESGKELKLPYGSPLHLSPWEKILINPKQLFKLPTPSINDINTATVIGPRAKKPLKLEIPIMITGMSYGGSLSLEMKMALAKGASLAGTSSNTGESTVTQEVRDSAKYLIGQYNRGGWQTSHEHLSKLDAIEVQFGQGAWGGAVESTTKAKDIKDHLRKTWELEEGEDATLYSRMPKPKIDSPEGIIKLIKDLKNKYDVPVGIKIAGSDYIEYDLEVVIKSDADFITIDGCEGGTAVAPPTLEDNLGLPTLHSLARTINYLEEKGVKDKLSVIIAGGLSTPGHFLKAIALGADAVYIGSIAIFATIHSQAVKALPDTLPTQMALYTGKLTDKLDIDKGAKALENFLNSCIAEMKLAIQAIGKYSFEELDKDDLVSLDKELSEFLNIRCALSKRKPKD